MTWDNDCSKDIQRRIQNPSGALAGFNTQYGRVKGISIETKFTVLNVCAMSVYYAADTWTLRKKDKVQTESVPDEMFQTNSE